MPWHCQAVHLHADHCQAVHLHADHCQAVHLHADHSQAVHLHADFGLAINLPPQSPTTSISRRTSYQHPRTGTHSWELSFAQEHIQNKNVNQGIKGHVHSWESCHMRYIIALHSVNDLYRHSATVLVQRMSAQQICQPPTHKTVAFILFLCE